MRKTLQSFSRPVRGRWLALLALVALNQGCGQSGGGGRVLVIKPGVEAAQEAQLALIEAVPGDVIEFAAGRYEFESALSLDIPRVTIRGQGADKTTLSFQHQEQGTGGEGLLVTKGPFVLEDLAIEDAKGDGVKVNGADGVTLRRVHVLWSGGPQTSNGGYGLYPVLSSNVLVEDCQVEGASDAGIYVGQSTNIIVRRNRVERNVAGIEIENSVAADVYENVATNNAGGILVFTLPDLPRKVGKQCRVFNNRIVANNHENFAAPGNIVATVPPGTGLLLLANDETEVFENRFENNDTVNLGVFGYEITQKKFKDPDYDPTCEAISIHDNHFEGGGHRPSGQLGLLFGLMLGGKIPDIVYDGIENPARLVDGKLPADLRLSIRHNGDAKFVNLDLPHADFSGLIPKPGRIGRDLAPYDIQRQPLPIVRIAGVK